MRGASDEADLVGADSAQPDHADKGVGSSLRGMLSW